MLELFTKSQIGNKYKRWEFVRRLADHIDLNPLKIVEIGTYKGSFSCNIRAIYPNSKLYLIDPWELTEDYVENGYPVTESVDDINSAYDRVVEMFKDDKNTTIMRTTSDEALREFEYETLDVVFIDGDHSYEQCKKDICNWKDKVVSGGILCGHDYKTIKNVRKAVSEVFDDFVVSGYNKGDVWARVM